jgi:hypothetical protein
MVEVAQRENPGFGYQVADLRELPFEDASLVGWCAGSRWSSWRRTPGHVRSLNSPES